MMWLRRGEVLSTLAHSSNKSSLYLLFIDFTKWLSLWLARAYSLSGPCWKSRHGKSRRSQVTTWIHLAFDGSVQLRLTWRCVSRYLMFLFGVWLLRRRIIIVVWTYLLRSQIHIGNIWGDEEKHLGRVYVWIVIFNELQTTCKCLPKANAGYF